MLNIIDLQKYKNVKFIGDIHGLYEPMMYDIAKVRKVKNCVIVVCGDIGLGFAMPDKEREILEGISKRLAELNDVLVLYRGNHDCPERYKIGNPWNARVSASAPNVKVVPDYTVLKTTSGNILIVGGAVSIDRTNRLMDYTYWRGEEVQPVPDSLCDELAEHEISIDVVCTHTAPMFCLPYNKSIDDQGDAVEGWSTYDPMLKQNNWDERRRLDMLYETLVAGGHTIKHWIYGHFHKHFEVVYQNVKCVGLDMCVSLTARRTGDDGKAYYVFLDDWYYVKGRGKKGNVSPDGETAKYKCVF